MGHRNQMMIVFQNVKIYAAQPMNSARSTLHQDDNITINILSY